MKALIYGRKCDFMVERKRKPSFSPQTGMAANQRWALRAPCVSAPWLAATSVLPVAFKHLKPPTASTCLSVSPAVEKCCWITEGPELRCRHLKRLQNIFAAPPHSTILPRTAALFAHCCATTTLKIKRAFTAVLLRFTIYYIHYFVARVSLNIHNITVVWLPCSIGCINAQTCCNVWASDTALDFTFFWSSLQLFYHKQLKLNVFSLLLR